MSDVHLLHYEWETAYGWLRGKYSLPDQIWSLLSTLDSDTIQDQFQDEMDADRYFDLLFDVPCNACGRRVYSDPNGTDDLDGQECRRCRAVYHNTCGFTEEVSLEEHICDECQREDL